MIIIICKRSYNNTYPTKAAKHMGRIATKSKPICVWRRSTHHTHCNYTICINCNKFNVCRLSFQWSALASSHALARSLAHSRVMIIIIIYNIIRSYIFNLRRYSWFYLTSIDPLRRATSATPAMQTQIETKSVASVCFGSILMCATRCSGMWRQCKSSALTHDSDYFIQHTGDIVFGSRKSQ